MSAAPDPAKVTGKTLAKTLAKPPPKVGTTGHEWDGIQELNTPLPRWWLWMFYATIIWSIGYWVVYPSWPLISSYSGGLFHWHTRSSVASQLAELQQERGAMMTKLSAASLKEIETTPELLDFARALGRRAFADNCAPCHGAAPGRRFGKTAGRHRPPLAEQSRRTASETGRASPVSCRRRCRPRPTPTAASRSWRRSRRRRGIATAGAPAASRRPRPARAQTDAPDSRDRRAL